MSLRTELRARASLERRALTAEEKAAGYIGALRGTIPYDADSEVLTQRGRPRPFVERIAPGAFDASLVGRRDIVAAAGHTDDPLASLGRVGANLTLASDARALTWEALVPDTSAGRDLVTLVDKGIITGTSFEFEVDGEAGQKWEARDARTDQRTITSARLVALNPVVWPAYSDSSLTVELRRRCAPAAGETRGAYLSHDGEPAADWSDPTLSGPVKFATAALHRAIYALADAQEFLRAEAALVAAGQPASDAAIVALAGAEATAAAERAAALVDWVAANGAAVPAAVLDRARARLAEARTAAAAAPADAAALELALRERRRRRLQFPSR